MPNWCYTNYMFTGDEGEIKQFSERIAHAMVVNRVPNDWGRTFLGNILEEFGTSYDAVRCRGCIMDIMEHDKKTLEIMTETAWVPMSEVWDVILVNYKSISYVMMAEEPGCDLFINTDTSGVYYSTKYRVYLSFDDESEENTEEYFDTLDEMFEFLSAILHKSIDNMSDIEAINEDEHSGVRVYVNEYDEHKL